MDVEVKSVKVKGEICSSVDCDPYTNDGQLKVENLEITEQLIDPNEIYKKKATPERELDEQCNANKLKDPTITIRLSHSSPPPLYYLPPKKPGHQQTPLVRMVAAESRPKDHNSNDENSIAARHDLVKGTDDTKVKPIFLECSFCDYTTNIKHRLTSHWNAVHLNYRPHKCDQCSYATANKSNLTKHVEAFHIGPFTCEKCGYVANRRKDLIIHKRKRSKKEIKHYKCDLCDYTTSKNNRLTEHVKGVHMKVRNYLCDQCDFTTNRRNYLNFHIKNVHVNLREHKCHLCDFASNFESHLKKHVDYYHLNLNKVKCDQCDYTTNQKTNLKRHIQCVHLNSKPYKCHLCDFATNIKQRVKKHVDVIHSKDK